jgi:hypothetical protein
MLEFGHEFGTAVDLDGLARQINPTAIAAREDTRGSQLYAKFCKKLRFDPQFQLDATPITVTAYRNKANAFRQACMCYGGICHPQDRRGVSMTSDRQRDASGEALGCKP